MSSAVPIHTSLVYSSPYFFMKTASCLSKILRIIENLLWKLCNIQTIRYNSEIFSLGFYGWVLILKFFKHHQLKELLWENSCINDFSNFDRDSSSSFSEKFFCLSNSQISISLGGWKVQFANFNSVPRMILFLKLIVI